MAFAISVIMFSTYHGLCTFHIRVNFMKHLENYYKDGSNLLYRFVECMYEKEDENEVIVIWDSMLKEHKFETKEWLCPMQTFKHFFPIFSKKKKKHFHSIRWIDKKNKEKKNLSPTE